ncbi:MAG: glycosyltransferase family 2 protein [Kiritimatiellae bacterium]|nr:glycosyltransferase family 2 protein [Kiritimatiellia bacterium]
MKDVHAAGKIAVSVIVPVYNALAYLNRCTESVLEQTFRDFELILVDDGSTDGSGERCDEWARRDGRVRVFHQANAGQSAARNFAVRHSSGEWVAFVDADDYVAPDYLEYLLGLAEKTGAGIAVCRRSRTQGEELKGEADDRMEVYEPVEACLRLLRGTVPMDAPHSKIIRRELVEAWPFPEGRVYEDTAVMGQLFYSAGKVVLGWRILYAYFTNPGSTTQVRSAKTYRDHLWANRVSAEFFEGAGERRLARQVWDNLRMVLLSHVRQEALPLGELREWGRISAQSRGSWGSWGVKCRLALASPAEYRLWHRMAGAWRERRKQKPQKGKTVCRNPVAGEQKNG